MPSSSPLTGFESQLVQLPNKDLWRGYKHVAAPEREDTVDTTPDPEPVSALDGAYAACVASAHGAHEVPCLWCGMQFPLAKGNDLKTHIATQHRLAIARPTDNDIAAALIAQEADNDAGK